MRHSILVLTLLLSCGNPCAAKDRHVTFAEIHEAYQSHSELTAEQQTYLRAIFATLASIDAEYWGEHDRGLYCLPASQRLTQDLLLSVMDKEIKSDHGWMYANDDSVARIMSIGMMRQYPCTDEAVERVKKEGREFLKRNGIKEG
jgi:hypothetical protein